ncbi:hypothetical protein [Clostridium aminobutyricum]|uniref:Uncharacterized protein n=1 Tax=Clostridium aminobutyricum TaxID=33953 RepID=A0A939D639_CLOAM|nr:hypothetical protein [Clostridium aminobutyricum]MBN7772194.1 hypothetical protein [Clostridium aminobutyricum]
MKLSLNNKEKNVLFIIVGVVFVAIIISYGMNRSASDFTQQPGYEQKLKNAIEKKDQELSSETVNNNDYFIVTKEMKENPRYQNPDGSVNYEAICVDLGISISTPEGALKEIYLSTVDNHIEPHVLEHAEIAIYSDENDNPWTLKKGDKVKFHTYVDTEYYNHVGQIYFGALKDGETFMTDNLGEGTSVDSEKEFEYVVPESGQYHFYLFRGSTEPIVIKWIKISKN